MSRSAARTRYDWYVSSSPNAHVMTPTRIFGLLLLSSALALGACGTSPLAGVESGQLAEGTWGGDDAGLIVDGARAHVHFGCTSGDFSAPVAVDATGSFRVSGEYTPRLHPIAVGPAMPAELTGVVRPQGLTMTVTVNDTIEGGTIVFGPTTVRFGEQPRMQNCPICAPPR